MLYVAKSQEIVTVCTPGLDLDRGIQDFRSPEGARDFLIVWKGQNTEFFDSLCALSAHSNCHHDFLWRQRLMECVPSPFGS